MIRLTPEVSSECARACSLRVSPRPGTLRRFAALASLLSAAVGAVAQPCPAPASWFPHSQTPPANPATFPNPATDCDFHQWAWQTFLYMTQLENGQMRFLSYPTDADLFPSDPTVKPLALAALKPRTQRGPLQLKVRKPKPPKGGEVENPNSIVQAGSGGILVDQNGNPLYYSIHVNPVYYSFVESNHYYDYNTYIKAGATTTFPVGAIELKASWQIVTGSAKPNAYTIAAEVPTLTQDSSGNITAGPPMRSVTVALVGFHVVGVVANHPEFIWATFEQVANAPDLPPGMSITSDKPVSASNFNFYKANTAAKDCNQQPTSYTLTGQTLSPITQVFRQFRDGGGAVENVAAIETLNASVQKQLGADMAANYRLIGGVWLLPGELQPGVVQGPKEQHGSPNLSNATMETFVQAPAKNSTPPPDFFTSCLSCHVTSATTTGANNLPIPAMDMNLSHVLTDGLVTREASRRRLLQR
jgi:hypothetical protein